MGLFFAVGLVLLPWGYGCRWSEAMEWFVGGSGFWLASLGVVVADFGLFRPRMAVIGGSGQAGANLIGLHYPAQKV